MIEADLIARLDAEPALAALVGGQFFPVEAPTEAAPPYLVYRRMDTDPSPTFDGKSVEAIALVFECHASSFAASLAIGEALKAAFAGWRTEHPLTAMAMLFAGEHDGAGAFDEAQRKRRGFCRELVFTALVRA